MAVRVATREIRAADGLRLHVRSYAPPADSGTRPSVVCLPGLARTIDDFDTLANRLAAEGTRVIAPDYRGRGGSDFDHDWRRYTLDVEGDDVLAVLAAFDITRAVFVGTSRGGIHAMRFAAMRPDLVAAAVLNDIGPVLEPDGLRRIRGYVGVGAEPTTRLAAIEAVKAAAAGRFPALDEAGWTALADMTYRKPDGTYGRRYDPALGRTLEGLDLDEAQPTFWPVFEALGDRPVLVVRGECSDLLSAETLVAMTARLPACTRHVVPGQGHAPLLTDQPTLDRIATFVRSALGGT